MVSNKTDKTVTVLVERRFMHPIYKKYIKKTSKFAAHDANNEFNVGDRISIIECRPISKTKRWTVMKDGVQVTPSPADAKAEKKTAAKSKAKAAPKKAAAKKSDDKKAAPKKAAAKKTTKKKDA